MKLQPWVLTRLIIRYLSPSYQQRLYNLYQINTIQHTTFILLQYRCHMKQKQFLWSLCKNINITPIFLVFWALAVHGTNGFVILFHSPLGDTPPDYSFLFPLFSDLPKCHTSISFSVLLASTIHSFLHPSFIHCFKCPIHANPCGFMSLTMFMKPISCYISWFVLTLHILVLPCTNP